MSRASALLLVFALCCALPAQAQSLVRQPYLQTGTPNSIVIVWRTSVATDSQVRYGPSPTQLTQTAGSSAAVTDHVVKLTGLTPGTRYYYSVGTSTQVLAGADAEHSFTTSPAVGTRKKFRLWVVGDSGDGSLRQAQVRDAMLNTVGAQRPDLFLHMGDMAYETGTDSEFTTRFFAPYASILRNTVVWPAMGNHEGASSNALTETGPYYQAYVLPRGAEAGGLASGAEAYYSFDYANVHFIVLDSHQTSLSTTGPMLTWLRNDLAATSQDWIIAYWHHPPYTKGTHDSDTESREIQVRERALPILEAAGVDLVLAGHSHIYERSYLVDGAYDTPTTAPGHILDPGDGKPDGGGAYQKPAGRAARSGAVYVVAGHGGRGVGRAGTHPLMYMTEVANGSCIFDIDGNRLDWINIRADGVQSDHFSLVKGGGLRLTNPAAREVLLPQSVYTLRWNSWGSVANVRLEYSTDDGTNWSPIVTSTPNSGQYAWTVPVVDSTLARMRITDVADSSVSHVSPAAFTISARGGFQVTAPSGGEVLSPGTSVPIRWTTVGSIAQVRLEFSSDRGERWSDIIASAPNTGEYLWTVPPVPTSFGVVRVSNATDRTVADASEGFFTIRYQPQRVISFGDVWRYHDTGADPGAGWTAPGFNDSAWKSGPGEFGYGESDEATPLVDADPNHPGAYFRKKVRLDGRVTEATLRVRYDDGAAVWINGQQVFARNIGSVEHTAWASGSSTDNETSTANVALSPNPFVVGENVIAAVVKQANATSSDLSFNLELAVSLQASSGTDGGTGSTDGGTGGTDGGTGGTDGGTGGTDGGTGGTDGGTGGTDGGQFPSPGGGEDIEAEGGCGCQSAGPLSSVAFFALLAGLRVRTRRSRRS
jgi:hypothetical protein